MSSGIFDPVRFKPACAATDVRKRLAISDKVAGGIILSRHQTAKALIRLRWCVGLSASLLFTYAKKRFYYDVVHIIHIHSDVNILSNQEKFKSAIPDVLKILFYWRDNILSGKMYIYFYSMACLYRPDQINYRKQYMTKKPHLHFCLISYFIFLQIWFRNRELSASNIVHHISANLIQKRRIICIV